MDFSLSLSELMALAHFDPNCLVGVYHSGRVYHCPSGLLYHFVRSLDVYPDVYFLEPELSSNPPYQCVESVDQLAFLEAKKKDA